VSRSKPKKTILVVEDGTFNRDLLIQLLGDEYQVVVAVDGEEGVRKAEQEKPDLILMDLGLPGLNGWESTERIKANSGLRHIPIIAVTSHVMIGDERRAREVGCNDYLSKPIDEDELLGKIRNLI
jgi:CheY-like chemotaxis protein